MKKYQISIRISFFFILSALMIYLFYFSIPRELRMLNELRTIRTPAETPMQYLYILSSFLAVTIMFVWVSARSFWFRFLFIVFLFAPSAMIWYIAFKYNQCFSDIFALTVIATTRNDAFGFINLQLFLFWGIFIAFFLGLALLLPRFKINFKNFSKRKIILANILFFIIFIASVKVNVYPLRSYYIAIRKLYMAKIDLLEFIPRMRILEKTEEPYFLEKPLPKDSLLLFHIGESARGDHASINGYERNTMPKMLVEQKKGNLFSFKNAISFATLTRTSVVGMLTPSSIKDPVIRSSSFIPFLQRNGIKLSSFFSSVDPYTTTTRLDATMNVYAATISDHYTSLDLAHSLLPTIKTFFNSHKDSENRFILYQGEGSHIPYKTYDKEKFSVFTPVNFKANADYTTTNAYDNTIVCLDDFVYEIINMAHDKNFVYIYSSDHGDLVGDGGYWGRGSSIEDVSLYNKCMRNILFFIWVSDKFKQEEPTKFNSLKNNAARLNVISHDHLYHTVLGFYGIKNNHYDRNLDLFSPHAKPFAGPMPEKTDQSDIDILKFAKDAKDGDTVDQKDL